MAPRRRMTQNAGLPTGLNQIKKRGVKRWRYRYPSGKDVYLPVETTRHDAVEAASLFNAKYRNPTISLIERADRYNKPLEYWLPKILRRVREEEQMSSDTQKTFEADCERLTLLFGKTYTKAITLRHVNEYLEKYCTGKSNNVYNRKISFLQKVFTYLIDESAMDLNFADQKKKKRKEGKRRKRLTAEAFKLIHEAAPVYLKVAMELSMQTTHAVLEISRIQYKDCVWLDKPVVEEGMMVFGYLRIHRQKTEEKEASRVEIPITKELKRVIERSRDRLLSPYIVHRRGRYPKRVGEGCDHPTQVASKYISREFSKLRDQLGLFSELSKIERPSFHEIRALSARAYKDGGYDPQARMAHSDAKSTKVYTENHKLWTRVPPGEIAI